MYKIIIFLISFFIISCSQKKQFTIAIQPFEFLDTTTLNIIKKNFKEKLKAEILVLDNKPMPASSFINIKSPRYRADSLLKILKRDIPKNVDYIIGITNKDISTTKKDKNGNCKEPKSVYQDWGVYGLGYVPGKACIVSTKRFDDNNNLIFYERLKKITLHEIGHNLGLQHCTKNKKCVMNDAAETIKTIDNVENNFCESCQKNQ